MASQVLVAVDGGGTLTRVLCLDPSGKVLGYVEGAGANPNHNREAALNVQNTMARALVVAGAEPSRVIGVVAGLAGLDEAEHLSWAEEMTALPGLSAPRLHLNDAEIAWAGAFTGAPGIIAVSGTGSIVWGRTAAARVVRNYDFNHYARSGARHLAYGAVQRFIVGEACPEDSALLMAMLEHFGCRSLLELRDFAACHGLNPGLDVNRTYADFAPQITRAALSHSPLAAAVCDHAVRSLVLGIRLVASAFDSAEVPVALIGSVVEGAYMRAECARQLAALGRALSLRAPRLSPVGGAALLALEQAGAPPAARERLASEIAGSGA